MNEKKTDPEREKVISRSISLPESWFEKLDDQAKEHFGGNRSKYLQSLIGRDLDNGPANPLSKTIIVDLARVLVGELDAEELKAHLKDKDQRKLLQAWIRQTVEAASEEPKSNGKAIAKAIREQFESQPSIAEQMLAKTRKGRAETA